MMNNLQVFENSEFGRLEVYEINGKPYFPATKCAEVLGYTNPQKAIRDHCKGVNESCTPTPGGIQTIKVIPEGDLYRLIIRSNMPKAQEFERWVFDEVLPQIRQTGTYNLIPKTFPEALRAYANEVERSQALEAENLKMLPKAEFYDAVAEVENLINMASVAKALNIPGIGRNNLFKELRKRRVLMVNNQPYQKDIVNGYFVVRQRVIPMGDRNETRFQTYVTGKGMQYIQRVLTEPSSI